MKWRQDEDERTQGKKARGRGRPGHGRVGRPRETGGTERLRSARHVATADSVEVHLCPMGVDFELKGLSQVRVKLRVQNSDQTPVS